jgi:hypothetical protein
MEALLVASYLQSMTLHAEVVMSVNFLAELCCCAKTGWLAVKTWLQNP